VAALYWKDTDVLNVVRREEDKGMKRIKEREKVVEG
jgi:hypothetical protein